jgi:hypothetical protein
MDLYVWFSNGAPVRFHLTGNRQGSCHSACWNYETGFRQKHIAQIEALAAMNGPQHFVNAFYNEDTTDIRISRLASSFFHMQVKIPLAGRLYLCPAA